MDAALKAMPGEAELLKRAVADPAAFSAVYKHYFSPIYNYIRYRVQDATVADDLTTRTFERVLRNLATYDAEKGAFPAWLFTIARNAVSDCFRAQKRRRWLSLDVLRNRAGPAPDPEEIVAANEARVELLQAVAQLPDRERDLIALKFGAGLTNRHIAGLTGLGESNVAVILYRTVRVLREKLGERE